MSYLSNFRKRDPRPRHLGVRVEGVIEFPYNTCHRNSATVVVSTNSKFVFSPKFGASGYLFRQIYFSKNHKTIRMTLKDFIPETCTGN